MFVYNLSLLLFFMTLFQTILTNTKSLQTFTNLGAQNILTKILIILLLSMAGVPPFLGFFTKVLLFILLLNLKFSFVFVVFFSLLLVTLYFYLQNVRFLNATAPAKFVPITDEQLQVAPIFFYTALFGLFYLVFGSLVFEDMLLLAY